MVQPVGATCVIFYIINNSSQYGIMISYYNIFYDCDIYYNSFSLCNLYLKLF